MAHTEDRTTMENKRPPMRYQASLLPIRRIQPYGLETSSRQASTRRISKRERLSDAAYWGDWHQLLSSLDTGRRRYDESWCNSFNLSMRLCQVNSVMAA